MGNRRRTFWKKAGRSAWICAAIWAALIGVLYLTVKEYGLYTKLAVSPDGPQADSIAVSVAHRLNSSHLAKGGALSAMEGDYSSLLAKSIAEPKGRVNRVLNSFNPDSSLLAMKKLCVWARGNEIKIGYFSYDSLAAERTFGFYKGQCEGMLPKGFALSEVKGNSFWDNLFGGEWAGTFPWRTSAIALVILFLAWLLICAVSGIFFRKKRPFRNLDEVSDVLLGVVEEVPLSKEKYSNALRWKAQAENIAEAIRSKAGCYGALVNILGMDEKALYSFRRAGCLSALSGEKDVRVIEAEKALDALSTAYLYPDIPKLKEDNSGSILVMVHPPLSGCSVPAAYLENAALNVLVSDSSAGWTEAHKALCSGIPSCKLVLTGMETGTSGVKIEGKRAKKYLPSEKRWRYIVLLSECGSDYLRDKTVRSLWESAFGEDSGKEEDALAMEVSALNVEYKVAAFRKGSSLLLQNLEFSPQDADAVIMLKAGCTVEKNFFSDISAALSAGQDAVQCRVKDKNYSSRPSHRAMQRSVRKGNGCPLLKYGFAIARKKSEYFSDYLSNTIVNFS